MRYALRLFALGWFAMTSAAIAQTSTPGTTDAKNLFPNGSFEEIDQGAAKGWYYYSAAPGNIPRGKLIVDDKVAHKGKACVTVELTSEDCKTGMGYAGWHPVDINVKPNTAYKLHAWVKVTMAKPTGNKATDGAWFWIYGYRKGETQVVGIGDSGGVNPTIEYFQDVSEWREVVVDFITGKNIDRCNVWLRLDGTGTAWFDDISLVESRE